MVFNLKSKSRWLALLTLLFVSVLFLLIGNNRDALRKSELSGGMIVENLGWNVTKRSGAIVEEQSLHQINDLIEPEDGKKVLILFWSDYYWIKGKQILEKFIFPARKWDEKCCTGNVEVTTDKSKLDNATSVVFFGYPDNLKRKFMPTERPKGQLWVLFSKESPTYSASLTGFRNTFNWTMSYRRDSDIWAPYGEKIELDYPVLSPTPIQMPGGIPLYKWIQNKTKLLAWVSSNCKTRSKRELFKNALKEEGPNIIDVFGGCGKHICSRRNDACDHNKFWDNLARTYKFYFAAENSLCVDYITEKFWRTLEVGMVPVVYGGADYSAVAPPNSYIDVRDFKSPKELVDYLQKVDKDPEEYAKYFEWKRIYRVETTDCWKGWCELCRRTVQYEASPSNVQLNDKVHSDLHSWWFKGPLKMGSDKYSKSASACFKGPLLITMTRSQILNPII